MTRFQSPPFEFVLEIDDFVVLELDDFFFAVKKKKELDDF